MTDDKKNFPRGIFIDKPREGAPEFVRGKIGIKVEDAIPWLQENANEKGYVNLDVLLSQEGKLYLKHNDWKPEAKSDLPEGF